MFSHFSLKVIPAMKNSRHTRKNNKRHAFPKCILDMKNITCLDLSVNNLQRLPDELWGLPLYELNLSHNPSLGRTLLSSLDEAAGCTTLKKLLLRNVTKGEA